MRLTTTIFLLLFACITQAQLNMLPRQYVQPIAVNIVYATWDAANLPSGVSLNPDNLSNMSAAMQVGQLVGNIGFSTGVKYFEAVATLVSSGSNSGLQVGVVNSSAVQSAVFANNTTGQCYHSNGNGNSYNKYANGFTLANTGQIVTGDIIGVVVNFTANTITYYKNGVNEGSFTLGAAMTGTLYFASNDISGFNCIITARFDPATWTQRPAGITNVNAVF